MYSTMWPKVSFLEYPVFVTLYHGLILLELNKQNLSSAGRFQETIEKSSQNVILTLLRLHYFVSK